MWFPLLLLLVASEVTSLKNGLALTPPMGWMTWQRYRCVTNCDLYPDDCLSDSLIRRMADEMVNGGYLKAGYEYLVIDDCWLEKDRNPITKSLIPDRVRFPHGFQDLSDYIHKKGLKFGLYQDYGTKTCAGFPGLMGHVENDIDQFVSWGVDYVKIDGCYHEDFNYANDYEKLQTILNKTGRPIVYSCSYPAYQQESCTAINYSRLSENCNLWRNFDDIDDSWTSVLEIIDYFGSQQEVIAKHAGPGHWNDPDMLIIGNFGLSYDQSKAQMALWAILAAPLFMSTDLSKIRPEFREILLNPRVIAINQDLLGIQGKRVYRKDMIEVWLKRVTPIINSESSYAIAILSRRVDGYPRGFNVTFAHFGLNSGSYNVEDVFENQLLSSCHDPKSVFSVKVNPSGVRLLKAVPTRSDAHSVKVLRDL